MKKIIAVMISVILCISVFAFAETQVIDYTPAAGYVPVDLTNGAVTAIPADWSALDVEYSDDDGALLGSFSGATGCEILVITRSAIETPSDCETVCAESLAAGIDAGLIEINGNQYVAINVGDEEQYVLLVMTFENPNTVVTFAFSADTEEAIRDTVVQALGSYTVK